MAPFRKTARKRGYSDDQRSEPYPDARPNWMRDGIKLSLMVGDDDLEVVGESHYQDNLWRLVGRLRETGEHVREDIYAILVAEDHNPYDANAISVWIRGLKVGHLSRDNARRYRPGLLAQQAAQGKPIALAGVITGGGMRADGPGMLGVFLRHDPDDFGIEPTLPPPPTVSGMRTALPNALVPDNDDNSNHLSWRTGLPEDSSRSSSISINSRRFSTAELEDARMTYLTNYNHRNMNSGRGSAEITIVVGTSRFQEQLREAVSTPRPWRDRWDRHLPAILAREKDESREIAVYIDGNIIGYLTKEVADQHQQQLDELERYHQYLVCSALIVGGNTDRKFGVRLQVKPEIGRRWAANAKLSI